MSVLLLRRYAALDPSTGNEIHITYLLRAQMYQEAVSLLAKALSDPKWQPKDASREQLWMQLVTVAADHSILSVDIPALLRAAIREEGGLVAELWVGLADYFTRCGLFDSAHDVYEEALSSLSSVRDFAIVFNASANFQEALVAATMQRIEDPLDSSELAEAESYLDILMARLELLTSRRPMLLSDVSLRQNPHNVQEWHKRARMFKREKDAVNVVDTYTKAIKSVDPWRSSNGRPHTLWLAFARYYEDAHELVSARRVFDKAVQSPEAFRSAEDLAAVWCEYAEMELRAGQPVEARKVLLRAITPPSKETVAELKSGIESMKNSNLEAVVGTGVGNVAISFDYDSSSPAWNAYKSRRIWHCLIDLTHSISSVDDVMKLHHRMLDSHIATAQTVLSGAAYLESNRFFEQAFRLYEKGVSSIPWPHALQIWVMYLTRFVKRFGSRKLERSRDLFEEAIRSAPTSKKGGHVYPHPQVRVLYLMYADMEEQNSLARHALKIFARAARAVQEEDRPDMYRLYIVKLATMFGVTKTRPVYEEALLSLKKPEEVIDFAVRYAAMETRLGEIDRARGIYSQACEIADPRVVGIFEMFWQSWNDFELTHGSEDTFRDMLRMKRSVQLNHKGIVIDMSSIVKGDKEISNMVKDTIENSDNISNDQTVEGAVVPEADVNIQSEQVEDDGKSLQKNNDSGKLGQDEEHNREEIALDLSD